MFSRFFVRRPVFAWVIAILIMLAGILAIRTLPVAQYPDVAPPTCITDRSWRRTTVIWPSERQNRA
ncbi:efflux RND transporter permease subunit [Escherichia coli]